MAKVTVVFDVDESGAKVTDLHFASYLAEMLELPETNSKMWNITGIDNVTIDR